MALPKRDSVIAVAQQPRSFLPSAATTRGKSASRDRSYFYHSLVAGVCSGTASSVSCAPLDLLRTRLQVWGQATEAKPSRSQAAMSLIREIWQTEGWRGYFRGLTATLWTVPAFWGVYFPLYEEVKHYGTTHYQPYVHSSLIHLGAAVSAGAVADVLLNPMFVIRTRLQTEAMHASTSSTILQTASQLYREGGLPIFWRGMTANLLGLSHVAVQFPVYEQCKVALQVETSPSPLPLLAASAVSKMVACLLTYPHEVIRSRMMDSRTPGRLTATVVHMYQTEGLSSFYAGLPVSLLRVLPNTAVTFCVYEWTVATLRKRKQEGEGLF